MKYNIENASLSLGRNAGNELIKDIYKAKKSVFVISPYIANSYIDKLIDCHNRGVEVVLVTNDLDTKKNGEDIYRKLIDQKIHIDKRKQKLYKSLYLMVLVLYIIIVTGVYYETSLLKTIFTAVALIPVMAVSSKLINKIRVFTYSYKTLFHLMILISPYTNKMSKNQLFLHSKVYVIDENIVYIGSLNFTNAGQKYNYESCIKVMDKKLVKEIEKEVIALQNNPDVYCYDNEKLGSIIYRETRN